MGSVGRERVHSRARHFSPQVSRACGSCRDAWTRHEPLRQPGVGIAYAANRSRDRVRLPEVTDSRGRSAGVTASVRVSPFLGALKVDPNGRSLSFP